jgi:hypothetical protein
MGMVEAKCKRCGQTFFKYPSCTKKYCSSLCRRKSMAGANNPAYLGGKVLDTNLFVEVQRLRREKELLQQRVKELECLLK